MSMIALIGTVAVESAGTFGPVREAFYLPSDAAREAWYADTSRHAPYSGGTRYHGRGFIQTTHDYNYKRVGELLGVDLLADPDLLLQPVYAAQAAAIYWSDRRLHQVAERGDWAGIRRGVYGGADPDGTARIAFAAGLLLPLAQQRGFT